MNTHKETIEIIVDILVNKFFVTDEILQTREIQLESIQYIDLIVEIEEAFEIEIPDSFLAITENWKLDALIEVIDSELKRK